MQIGDGLYRIRFKFRDPKTGRVREGDRQVEARSPAHAAELRIQLRLEAERQALETRTRVRVREYATSWIERRIATLKPSTRWRYGYVLAQHVVPKLGDVFLDALSPADVARWRDEHPGQPATVNGSLRVLKTMLADATDELDLPKNPARRVASLRERRIDASPNCLTAPELDAVLRWMRLHEPAWFALTATLAMTGMRFGEATALKWSDLDVQGGEIIVRRAHWVGHVGTTKTDTVRRVPLVPDLRAILDERRRALVAQKHPGLAQDWVFATSEGTLLITSTLRKPFRRALAACGITRRQTIHGLRRTFNNLVRQVASGEVVRSMTGHVTAAMTEHYSHVGRAEKAAAVSLALALPAAPHSPPVGSGGDRVGIATNVRRPAA
jgi:integrase